MARDFTVKVNSMEKIEQLLQEIYNQSCQELVEIQGGINKIDSSTDLTEATIEEKAKYAKALNDFTNTKLKTIQMKFEVAKFMGEIIKHNGNIDDTLNDPNVAKATPFDVSAWKKAALIDTKEPEAEVYDLKK